MNRFLRAFILSLATLLFLFSCQDKPIPKPRAYFRIDFPNKEYHPLQLNTPYTFAIPNYAQVIEDIKSPEPYWINLDFPENNAELHISYKQINHNLATYAEESRSLAYKHSIKANAIDEQLFINSQKRVFGTVYYIRGNAASPMQFYLTDSTTHFLRGALYFNEVPNADSLAPVINFLTEDMLQLIETTSWN